MPNPEMHDSTIRLSLLEKAWPKPTPEVEQRCLQVLKTYEALDLAPMLGLVEDSILVH